MTLEQLERRVIDLEQQIVQLRRAFEASPGLKGMQETFGMFANDPEFDEIVRLGREYREQCNLKDE